MKKYKLLLLLLILPLFLGCSLLSSLQVSAPKPPLLEADKIYTIPKGTEISTIYLDKKQIGPRMFPYDMKVVSPNILVEQEEKFNLQLIKNLTSNNKFSIIMKIVIGIFVFFTVISFLSKKRKEAQEVKYL